MFFHTNYIIKIRQLDSLYLDKSDSDEAQACLFRSFLWF